MKIILPLLSVFFILSCSKIEFGYKIAPRVVMSRLDDSFDFKSDRFNQIRVQVENDFKNNKKEIAGTLNKNLDQLLELSEKKDLTAADFKVQFESVRTTQKKAIDLFKPSFEAVLKNLSKEEFSNLSAFSREKFADAERLLNKKEDFFEKQMSSFEKAMDFIFDSYTDDQVSLYKKFMEKNYSYFVYQLEVRKKFMQNFEAKLETKDQLLDYTLKYYSGDPSIRTSDQEKRQQEFFDSVFEFEYQTWKSTSDKQKASFKKTVISLKEEFTKLEK